MISVQQFVSDLDLEAQGAVLISKEAFLDFLRERYRGLDENASQVRRDLESAARKHASGQRIQVDAAPDERAAAQAVIYAILRLSDRVRDRAAGHDAIRVAPRPERKLAARANQQVADRINQAITGRARQTLEANSSSLTTRFDPSLKDDGAKALKRWKAGYNGAGGWATTDDLYPRSVLTVSLTADGRETARLSIRADQLEATIRELHRNQGRSRRHVAAIASALNSGAAVTCQAMHPKVEVIGKLLLREARRLAKRLPKLNAPPCLDVPLEHEQLEIRQRFTPSIPMIEVVPEVAETGQTIHFEASRRETGYGWLSINGEVLERVRHWASETPEAIPDPRTDSIRGGTVRRVEKPQGSRYLAAHETQVIRWNGRERLCGLGTRTGELWLCGTADPEVMIPIASRWVRTHRW
jgi:hypothetical protein